METINTYRSSGCVLCQQHTEVAIQELPSLGPSDSEAACQCTDPILTSEVFRLCWCTLLECSTVSSPLFPSNNLPVATGSYDSKKQVFLPLLPGTSRKVPANTLLSLLWRNKKTHSVTHSSIMRAGGQGRMNRDRERKSLFAHLWGREEFCWGESSTGHWIGGEAPRKAPTGEETRRQINHWQGLLTRHWDWREGGEQPESMVERPRRLWQGGWWHQGV